MKTRSYQIALAAAVSASLLLAVALAYVLYMHHPHAAPTTADDPVLARGPAAGSHAIPMSPAGNPPASDPPLAPLQLSSQRMHDIGITLATVEEKNVSNELQVPGNVEVDEQRLAYVQTRFPGWIQKVFANATYQYVRKGQPLFTIYSPDLVSSEQEYLLARQNQSALSKDAHGMAAQESGWLRESR